MDTKITLHDWIYSVYPPNSGISGRWELPHILTLAGCLLFVVLCSVLLRKNEKGKKILINGIFIALLVFELARRIINFSKGYPLTFNWFMYTMMPRPWCAISVWIMIITLFVKKRVMYNLSAMNALVCSIVFFVYPVVGFNNKYILFENLYSISTHALLLMGSILLITLGFTDFKYKRGGDFKRGMMPELIGFAIVFIWGFIEIFLLKIEADPLYFMPGSDVQEVVGLPYPWFLVLYIIFLAFYINIFYVIQYFVDKKRAEKLSVTAASSVSSPAAEADDHALDAAAEDGEKAEEPVGSV